MRPPLSKQIDGYTMLEIIVVLVLLGILGATALVKIKASSQIDALESADVLRRDIARIQAIALKTGVPLRLNVGIEITDVCNNVASTTFTTNTTTLPGLSQSCKRTVRSAYWVSCPKVIAGTLCLNTDKPIKDPATNTEFKYPTEAYNFAVVEQVAVSAADASSANASTVDFDSIGRPWSGTSLIAGNPARTFTLSAASKTATVTLRPITGFAEVSY
jgi:prepilin-type N-terminal cleavage/methylation domain-containing protein